MPKTHQHNCRVPWCHNTSLTFSVALHQFPESSDRKAIWCALIGIDLSLVQSKSSRLCSDHFSNHQFTNRHKLRLKRSAIPYLTNPGLQEIKDVGTLALKLLASTTDSFASRLSANKDKPFRKLAMAKKKPHVNRKSEIVSKKQPTLSLLLPKPTPVQIYAEPNSTSNTSNWIPIQSQIIQDPLNACTVGMIVPNSTFEPRIEPIPWNQSELDSQCQAETEAEPFPGQDFTKFSLEPFDSNVCLNCSVKFMYDGEIETQKIHYLEALDEEQQPVSVFVAFNSVFKIPLQGQIDMDIEQNVHYGCCPGCSTVLGQLYELQRQLDSVRNLNSVFSKMVEMDQANAVELEHNSNFQKINKDSNYTNFTSESEILQDPLGTSAEEMIVPDLTIQSKPEPVLLNQTELNPRSETETQNFTITKLQCINCCVEIQFGSYSTNRPPSVKVKQAVRTVFDMHAGVNSKIEITDLVNDILKLPPNNNLTADLKMCIDCARILLHIHVNLKNLKNASMPESRLNFIFQQIRNFRDSIEKRSGACYPKSKSLSVKRPWSSVDKHSVEFNSDITPTPFNPDTGHIEDEFMEVDIKPFLCTPGFEFENTSSIDGETNTVSEPNTTKNMKATVPAPPSEAAKRLKILGSSFTSELIIHDPCPHCGVILKNKDRNALKLHINLRHNFISAFTCDICGRPCTSNNTKLRHARTHLGPAEVSRLCSDLLNYY